MYNIFYLFTLFFFLVFTNCYAVNDKLIREYQLNSRKALTASQRAINKAFYRAAQRKMNKTQNSKIKIVKYWRSQQSDKTEISKLILTEPTHKSLQKAFKLSIKNTNSRTLQEYICKSLWELKQYEDARIYSKKYLQRYESVALHRYMLEDALRKANLRNAKAHYSVARLSLYEKVKYYLQILLLKYTVFDFLLFLMPVVLILLLILYLRSLRYKHIGDN